MNDILLSVSVIFKSFLIKLSRDYQKSAYHNIILSHSCTVNYKSLAFKNWCDEEVSWYLTMCFDPLETS